MIDKIQIDYQVFNPSKQAMSSDLIDMLLAMHIVGVVI